MIKPASQDDIRAQLREEAAVHYVYADPIVCGCLYVGSQQAYQQFQQHEQQQRLADEQRMTADSFSDSAWNWGAWGPWSSGLSFRYGQGW